MRPLKQDFSLASDVAFLNHGSFGACPKPVFAQYQVWQTRLERQPVQFIQRELDSYLAAARQALGDYLGVAGNDLVFMPNPTFAANTLARALKLEAGDELLTSDHEYGACINAWQFMSQRRGFKIVQQTLPFPPQSRQEIVERFWQGVTPNTKLIFLSHITSPTALTLPIEEICARARDAGILTIIDGAHAPSQLDLNIADIDPDFYAGTCHKWLCAPKGSSFLYARANQQALVEPLVVGWGWGDERTKRVGSTFLDNHQWLGTNDYSAYLTVPAAIQYQTERNWAAVRRRCHALVKKAVAQISEITGLPIIYQDDAFYSQMGLAELPIQPDLPAFKNRLYDQFQVEVPCIAWQERHFIRISVQGYNSQSDIEALADGLMSLLQKG